MRSTVHNPKKCEIGVGSIEERFCLCSISPLVPDDPHIGLLLFRLLHNVRACQYQLRRHEKRLDEKNRPEKNQDADNQQNEAQPRPAFAGRVGKDKRSDLG